MFIETVVKQEAVTDVQQDQLAILNIKLLQVTKETDELRVANDRLQKDLKFSRLQLTAKDQDIKDLQGELARRFLTTKESLTEKILQLQFELSSTQKKLSKLTLCNNCLITIL